MSLSSINANFYGSCWGNNLFVACTNTGLIYSSSDGKVWTNRPSPTTSALSKIAFGNNLFVIAGTGVILTSPDGMSWTSHAISGITFSGACWGNNKFVVVGNAGAIYTSPDGNTWTQRPAGTSNLTGVSWGNGLYVAVGDNGQIITSPDGYTWTSRASGVVSKLYGAIWGNNLWVAGGSNGTLITSPDGITWTQSGSALSSGYYCLTWANDQFEAGATQGAVLTSNDANTWTSHTFAGTNATVSDICAGNNTFVAVLASSSGGQIYSSPFAVTHPGTLTATVRNGATTAGIAGATIQMTSGGNQTKTTNSSGVAVFDGLAAGNYVFSIAATGFARDTGMPITITADQATSVTWSLTPQAPGNLTAIVRNSFTNALIAGATVQMTSSGNQSQTTDANGTVAFNNLIPGNYTFTVSEPGFQPDTGLVVSVTSGQTTTTYWSLAPLTAPAAPQLSSPSNAAADIPLTMTFCWNASPYADSYQVQASFSSAFTSPVVNQSGLSALQAIGAGLPVSSTIFWHVNATNMAGTGAWSATWSFATVPVPPAPPILASPSNGAAGITVTPIFSWSSSAGSKSYRFQVSSISNFSNTIVDQSTSSLLLLPPRLSYNTVYFWRGYAVNAGGNSAWSGAWSFTTAQSAVSPFGMLALPGFALSSAGIRYTLPEAVPVSLALFNLHGKLMRRVGTGIQSAGPHFIDFRLLKLTAGDYIVEFRYGSHMIRKKLVRAE